MASNGVERPVRSMRLKKLPYGLARNLLGPGAWAPADALYLALIRSIQKNNVT
jgi:hypothetical protein